jgi:hypothetical protein
MGQVIELEGTSEIEEAVFAIEECTEDEFNVLHCEVYY